VAGRFTIQRVPRGLLDVLALKATGDTPHELADSVSGGFDLSPFYLQDRIVSITGFIAGVATGYNLVRTVPAGEMWWMTNVGGLLTSGAAGAGKLSWCFRRQAASGDWKPFGLPEVVYVANDVRLTGGQINMGTMPLILSPGDDFGCYVGNFAGTATLFTNADYIRLTF